MKTKHSKKLDFSFFAMNTLVYSTYRKKGSL